MKKVLSLIAISGLFFFLYPGTSCVFYRLPETYESMSGNHCVLLYKGNTLDAVQYKNFLSIADMAFETVLRILDKAYGEKIFIVLDASGPAPNDWIIAVAHNSSVITWNDSVITMQQNELLPLLRHEMTHLVMQAYYPQTDCVIMNEGIACYVENHQCINIGSSWNDRILDFLPVNYYSLRDMDNTEISAIYCESGRFVRYWCSRFGLVDFYSLFSEVTTLNYRQMIEKHAGMDFELVITAYIDWANYL